MPSAVAAWRVSMRRARADWPIVMAAWLTMLLATTLLAAGPIYSAAVSVAGLREGLAGASIEDANIRVSARAPLDQLEAVDEQVSGELIRVAGSVPVELARLGTADTYELPFQAGASRDLALPGFAEGLERHATLIAGAWPEAGQEPAVEVAISEAVAEQLELAVGDRLDLVSRRDATLALPVSIAAIFRINDPDDPFWWSDSRMINGLTQSDQFRTFGPFFMTRADLLDRAAFAGVSLSWHLLPDYSAISSAEVVSLQFRLAAFPGRLDEVAGRHFPTIDTQLPQTLARATQALVVSSTGMLLVVGQLALLGAYSILLTAGLLISHRGIETALLRSRGAGPGQVAGLAAVEGLLLAVPAVLFGPWCAVLALGLFNRFGPLAEVGLSVSLQVTSDAYLLAGIAGAACVALLCLPALLSARAFSAEQRSLSRAETRPLAQRLGIDFALLALAAIALWQLRLYGAPLLRTVEGTLGPDPMLVAAPALGLLAGAVVAIRLLPRLAEGAEHILARGRGLVGALGSFQLARRPLRYTRSALMLMLAMSIGVFAISYSTTWTESQRSQADHQVGADVRVVPSQSGRALPDWSLAAAYEALPGVEQVMPIERSAIQLSRSVRGTLLALDARAAPEVVRLRPDQAAVPLYDLFGAMAAARPAITLATLPPESTGINVALAIDVRGLERIAVDPATGQSLRTAVDPAAFDDSALVGAGITVRDAHGLVHRFSAAPAAPGEARAGLAIPFSMQPDGPLEIVVIDFSLVLPPDLVVTDASFSVAAITAQSAGVAGTPVQLGPAGSWRLGRIDPRQDPIRLPPIGEGIGVEVGGGGLPELAAISSDPVTISIQHAALADLALGEIPILVSGQVLEAMAIADDDPLELELAGATRRLRIAGVVESFPTAERAEPLLIIDLPTLTLLRLQAAHALSNDPNPGLETRRPTEWWLHLDTPTDEIRSVLEAAPFISSSVTTAPGRLRSLASDPVPVGIIGALGLGATAAALFALIGLAVAAAVSANQRQKEFALLRALGLSRRQLVGWLWLENGSVAVVSLLAGTLIGLVISWVVLPSVTVTSDGLPPTPPVVVTLPLATIAAAALLAAAALGAVVLVTSAVLRRMAIGNVLRMGEE